MLVIRNKGQTEALSHINDYEVYEEVNGALELSLTSFSVENNPGHKLVEEEMVIQAEDGRDFRIKQMKEVRSSKEVNAISTFFDLNNHWKEDIYAGTRTFNEFATYLFAGTGWTFENIDVSGSKLIPNYGNDNFIVLLEKLMVAFDCERQIMPGNKIRFKRQLGPDNDAQYRYGHNIKALSRSVDTSNLEMAIKGIGGGGLEVMYVSPNASKFPHIDTTNPRIVSDERFTISQSLLEHIAQEITDVPEVSMELDALEISEKELGERVWVIDDVLGIGYQTRIFAKKIRIPKELSSAIIGNMTPKTLTDSLVEQKVEIDEHKKQTRSRFEQTNEKIELAVERLDGEIVEAYAQITITADEIRSEVAAIQTDIEGQITNANSTISQLAGVISLKADTSTVNSLGSRVTSAELKVDGFSGQISSKVSFSDYNGTTIASLINQSANNISISAQAIDLTGIVRVADSIELGYSSSYNRKVISFNGANAQIYSNGDFTLTLDATTIKATDRIVARHPSFNGNAGDNYLLPVVVGTSTAQRIALGISPTGILRVYNEYGVGYQYAPTGSA